MLQPFRNRSSFIILAWNYEGDSCILSALYRHLAQLESVLNCHPLCQLSSEAAIFRSELATNVCPGLGRQLASCRGASSIMPGDSAGKIREPKGSNLDQGPQLLFTLATGELIRAVAYVCVTAVAVITTNVAAAVASAFAAAVADTVAAGAAAAAAAEGLFVAEWNTNHHQITAWLALELEQKRTCKFQGVSLTTVPPAPHSRRIFLGFFNLENADDGFEPAHKSSLQITGRDGQLLRHQHTL
ncbi:hypothetical protein PoB_001927800 [Plakobranchus ocellatus]|uniref:Uncharacterized protein n=1 Tax=Plakobranchus ocellatus TaxID=259542 RepID=A0AAV3ZDV9_9GAST|nr:hypothetical protein PoB_001927800 [Plakobranchus ocellatus]